MTFLYKISEIHINNLEQPVGVNKDIIIGWELQSDRNQVWQQSYQIQISTTDDFQELIYDSGNVLSQESANITIQLTSIQSLCRYFVRCSSTNQYKESSGWSNTATFVTGILDESEWKGNFISAETEDDADNSKGTVLYQYFQCKEKPIHSAFMVSTALGLYDLKINGDRISGDELKPGWTSYGKRLLYQTYDVKHILQQGQNCISAMIGAGWYKGLMGFLLERNNYGKQTAFYCMLRICYEDGECEEIFTDEHWNGTDAPVTFAEIYNGEQYDARKEHILTLTDQHAQADQLSESAQVIHIVQNISYPFRQLVAQTGCGVRKKEAFQPVAIFTTPKGEKVLDFGQNMAGWVSFVGHGPVGESITLKHFEVLDQAGNVYTDNLRTAKQEFKVIFDGTESKVYEPHFTYMGFRYVQILTSSNQCRAEHFIAHALYSDMRECGKFECSDSLVNQLHHNIQWSMKGNFVDIPTDCPQRDERCGWTGDAQIFSTTASYLMDVSTFYQKWLDDMVADQTPEGGIPHIVPDILTNAKDNTNWLVSDGTHSASAWADAITIIPWLLYQTYGNPQILNRYYDSMKNWIDFMTAHATDGVFDYGVQLGDWLALDASEGSYYGATPNDYVCSVYYIYSCSLLVKAAKVLRRIEDVEKYESLYQKLLTQFRKHYVNEDGSLTSDTQTAYILALHFHMIPDDFREQAARHLVSLLKEQDNHLVTGFVGTPYFCDALSGNGYAKEAYQLLLRQEYPSWLYEVKKGATTIWEHWDGLKPDGTMWSDEMNSFNHYAYGAIGAWLYEECAGIQLDEEQPGFKHWIIHPCVNTFSYVKASYHSIYGVGRVDWKRKCSDDGILKSVISLCVEIPVNTTATVILDHCVKIIDSDGIIMEASEQGYQGNLSSGTYRIQYQMQ